MSAYNYLILRPHSGDRWEANLRRLKAMGATYVPDQKCWLLEAAKDEIPRAVASYHGSLLLETFADRYPPRFLATEVRRAANFQEDCR